MPNTVVFRGKGRGYAVYYEDDNQHEADDWADDNDYDHDYEGGYYEDEDYSQDPSPTAADSYYDETFEDFDTDAAYYQTLEDADPSEQAEEYDSAYASYIDARRRFNEIKLSRGYLPIVALTDGGNPASPSSSLSPVSPGRGKGKTKAKKGKGKGSSTLVKYPARGKGKEPDPKGRAKASGKHAYLLEVWPSGTHDLQLPCAQSWWWCIQAQDGTDRKHRRRRGARPCDLHGRPWVRAP